MKPLRLNFILEVKKKVPILCQIRCRELDTEAKLCFSSTLHPVRIFAITYVVDLQIKLNQKHWKDKMIFYNSYEDHKTQF